jgi:hypothetical protein
MARIPSPLHGKSVPKRVSRPTVTAEAAATAAESAVAPPAPRRARAAKAVAPAAPAAKKAAAGAKAKTATRATKATAGPAVPAAAAAKPGKAHKAKLVRDSFTIPKDEYAVLAALKARALGLGQRARKSELLRAGIQALAGMGDEAFLAAVGAVPTLKTGRPKKG